MLDNHPVFGGEAKQNQMVVDGVMLTGPQGSNDASVPQPNTSYGHVVGLWDEIGMPNSYDFVKPTGAGATLKYARDNFYPMYWNEAGTSLGYYFDKPLGSRRAWVVDPWSDHLQRAPIAAATRRDWLRWKNAPVLTRGDEATTDRWLDSMSYGDLIVRELGLSKALFPLADPLVATADYGVSSDAVSAYGAKLLGLPGTARDDGPPGEAFSFPGGNAAILRHIVKAMLPEAISGSRAFADVLYAPINFAALDRPQHTRIRLNATAVSVRHDGPPDTAGQVDVVYAVDGQLHKVSSKAAIVAAGGWVTRRIVRDLPESYRAAYEQFHHGPILVANVAVRNWQAMANLGITAARWFDGFGFFLNVRQPMLIEGVPVPLDPAKPAMLTLYIGLSAGRAVGGGANHERAGAPVQQQLCGAGARSAAAAAADVRKRRLRCAARHCRHHLQPLGACVHRAAAGLLFWLRRTARRRSRSSASVTDASPSATVNCPAARAGAARPRSRAARSSRCSRFWCDPPATAAARSASVGRALTKGY